MSSRSVLEELYEVSMCKFISFGVNRRHLKHIKGTYISEYCGLFYVAGLFNRVRYKKRSPLGQSHNPTKVKTAAAEYGSYRCEGE